MSYYQKHIQRLDKYLFEPGHKDLTHKSFRNSNKLIHIRVACFVMLSAIYLWALIAIEKMIDNLIYLTMEGYFLTWLYFALTVEDFYCRNRFKTEVFPGLWKIISIIYQVALCAELPITLIFWGFLLRILVQMPGITTEIIVMNVFLHLLPLVCLMVDLWFNCERFHKTHYWIILAFSLYYLILNMSYSLSVKVIYKPINWVSVLSYVLVVSCLGITYLVHYLGRLFYEKHKREKVSSLEVIESLDMQQQLNKQNPGL